MLVAAGLIWAMDHVRKWRLLGRLAVAGAAATLAVIAIGNVSMGLNAEYRFPGPFEYGSDARALSPELLAAKDWFGETQGENQRVVADRDLSLAFGALGFNWIEKAWSQNPLWQLYFQIDQPSEPLLNGLRYTGTRYMVADKRMTLGLPRTGVYMVPDEPQAHNRTTPPPTRAWTKYRVEPWTIGLYASDNIRIYRLDMPQVDVCTDHRRDDIGGPYCPGTAR